MLYKMKNDVSSQLLEKKLLFTNKMLFALIIPLILEQLLEVTVGMMDTLMVSAVGEAAVSGVSIVDEIMVLMINIFSALGTGGAVIVGHTIGQRDQKTKILAIEQSVCFITSVAVVIMILLYVGKSFILGFAFGSVDTDVIVNADIYYMIVLASIPFIALYNVGAAIFRVMGNSAISMKMSLLMNGINMMGNALLVYGLHMGTVGVAIPTLLSRVVASIVMTILLLRKCYHNQFKDMMSFKPHIAMIKRIMRIGIPTGMENGIFQLGRILTLSIISLLGTASIAANAVANKIVMFQIMPGAAVGLAMITVVSQCIGTGDIKQAKYYTKKLMKLTYILCFVMVTITVIGLPIILSWYHLSSYTTSLVNQLVIYHGLCMITIWPFAWALPYTLRASGDVRFTMVVSIISMWLFRVGLGAVLGTLMGLGIFGIWVAMSVDWLVRAICFSVRYINEKWIHKKV